MNAPTTSPAPLQPQRIDWSQFWYPGPTRTFTPDELARAGGDALSPTAWALALFYYLVLAGPLLWFAPARSVGPLAIVLVALALMSVVICRRLWHNPSRRSLFWLGLLGAMLLLALLLGIARSLADDRELKNWVGVVAALGALLTNILWWMVAVYRAHQIEARLREQAEHQQALDMARQLATAQIQPHFLFNSLASLQHWVQAKDDRAAPMLQALTGFLRATLPLFNRERLALGDEAEAVRQYLAVMQLRLGERLRFSMDLSSQAAAAQVPPGLLLTLVENAVEHGVMPCLGGAEVQVRAAVTSGQVQLQVQDSGPGLPAQAPEGVGLTNTRSRLAQAFGDRARLHLAPAEGGGCLASLHFPWTPSTPTPTGQPQPPTASSLP